MDWKTWVQSETLKMVLDTSLLNSRQYKVRIRVKWSNPGKCVVPSPTPRFSSYWKGSLLVFLDYGRQLYLHVMNIITWIQNFYFFLFFLLRLWIMLIYLYIFILWFHLKSLLNFFFYFSWFSTLNVVSVISISTRWNANNFDQDLNVVSWVYFLTVISWTPLRI